jgi:hypothetical protein
VSEEPNYTTSIKPGPLKIIQYSLDSGQDKILTLSVTDTATKGILKRMEFHSKGYFIHCKDKIPNF